MKKLYEKSAMWFAILCIVLYVVGASAADELSRALGAEKSVTLLFAAVFVLVLGGFVRKNHLAEYYGLCRMKCPASKVLFFLPLAVLASVNLWFGARMKCPVGETLCYVGSMLLVGFLEELIFRGFLFRAMSRDSRRAAIIVSSLTFGMGHIVNLINGSGADLVSNLCQVCYAAAIGFVFVLFFDRTGSLWPCAVTHGVFNALSIFSNEAAADAHLPGVSLALIVLSAGYALFLAKTLPAARQA